MAEEIVNRIASSKLITFNLEDYYSPGQRVLFDVKDWLLEGFVLREGDFRMQAKNHDWSQYQDKYIALTCSTDAIIPAWAFMLLATYLQPYAKKVINGDLETLETVLYTEVLQKMDISNFKDKPVIIKGCSNKPVPKNAYLLLIEKLQPVVKSLMYGEACSSVPLYKKPKK
ncbi:uncharacterized protein DUF2480 [Salegentibacter sp. 24]|jgi:hypothetical protein|uniref:DUF2480 family protein n=1 Tax=Salegentibacter sp. 24 TaxID=2183986 RepID=UPI001061AC40|nr:DUF2480 family protein [Salegentibacter sp. 24]TDN95161.1 uncharacterized protein DUF2480 [Salegentibacter sp. 24]